MFVFSAFCRGGFGVGEPQTGAFTLTIMKADLTGRTPKNLLVETGNGLWYKSEPMSRCAPKIFVVFLLSLALMYSGVAWAIDNCLTEHAHAEQDVAEHHHHEQDSENHKDSHDPSNPIVHCTSLFHHAGPSAVVASFNLFRSSKALPLHVSLIPDAVFPDTKANAWLQSLFKRILTVWLPTDRPHLFLSVLQI